MLNDRGLTNHENIFLDHAGVLRFLDCNVLYTVPIELAYSQRREALRQAYSSEILTLPVLPVTQRDGADSGMGLTALCEIVERRAGQADVKIEKMFAHRSLLERLSRISGGHLRNLFLLIRSAIDRSDDLPLTHEAVERTVRAQANSSALPLGAKKGKCSARFTARKPPSTMPQTGFGTAC